MKFEREVHYTERVEAFQYTESGVMPEGLEEAADHRVLMQRVRRDSRSMLNTRTQLKQPYIRWLDDYGDEVQANVGDWVVIHNGGDETDWAEITSWSDRDFRKAYQESEQ